MENRDKVIIGLVIVVVFAVSFMAGITGTASITAKCSDTDRGDLNPSEIYQQGTISGTSTNDVDFERTDYCVDSTYLKEYGCDLEKPAKYESRLVICENGCSEGACIQ